MRADKWRLAILTVTLSVLTVGIVWATIPRHTLAQTANAPTQPGVAISTGVTGRVDAGDVVTYHHTITNTGTVPAIFDIAASASEKWDLELYNLEFPGGTTIIMPFTLNAGEVTTVAVRLMVPSVVRPGTINTTYVTATVMETIIPYAHAVAYNTATVIRHLYLPLMMRAYAPFINGSFSNGLRGWQTGGVLGAALATDPDQPTNPVGLIGNPAFPCRAVPLGYGSLSQTFNVLQAPTGKSMHLQFRYRIYSNDHNVSLSGDKDTFDVLVNGVLRLRDANRGDFDYCNVPPYDLGWKSGDIDLGAGGLLVALSFQVHNRLDALFNTYVLIDDVVIVALE